MNIKEYLRKKGITSKEAAEQLGIHDSYLRLIWRGARAPGPKLALKIQEWTQGELKTEDMIDPDKARPCCKECGRILPAPKPLPKPKVIPAPFPTLSDQDKAEIAQKMLAKLFANLDINTNKLYT